MKNSTITWNVDRVRDAFNQRLQARQEVLHETTLRKGNDWRKSLEQYFERLPVNASQSTASRLMVSMPVRNT